MAAIKDFQGPPPQSQSELEQTLGRSLNDAQFAQLTAASKIVQESGITPDTGKEIKQNTQDIASLKTRVEENTEGVTEAKQKADNAESIAQQAKEAAATADGKAEGAQETANQAKEIAEQNKTAIGNANGPLVGKNDFNGDPVGTNDHAQVGVFGLVGQMPYLDPPLPIPNPGEATLAQVAEKQNEIITYLISLNRYQEGSGQMKGPDNADDE